MFTHEYLPPQSRFSTISLFRPNPVKSWQNLEKKNSAKVVVEPPTLGTVFLAPALYTGQPDALSNCARSLLLVRVIN